MQTAVLFVYKYSRHLSLAWCACVVTKSRAFNEQSNENRNALVRDKTISEKDD